MLQLIGRRGAVPRLVLDAAGDIGIELETKDAINGLPIEDIIYAGPTQVSHRIAAVHPADWRKGEAVGRVAECWHGACLPGGAAPDLPYLAVIIVC